MTASASQPKVRRERRIIERPRLMKLLDETDARTILLLAPAGYGKTTLARQWARTLNQAVWMTLTPAHRDVAALALDLAHACDDSIGGGTGRFAQSYLSAHSNPTRVARELGRALAKKLEQTGVQWLIFDDYHEVAGEVDVERFVEELIRHVGARNAIASRVRPSWASARLAIYGDVAEVRQTQLAMTPDEGSQLLGKGVEADRMLQMAEGWPALLSLACRADLSRLPGGALPSALLHEYFANELFMSVDASVRQQLMRLALAPDLEHETLRDLFGETCDEVVDLATELGFLTSTVGSKELHPLIRGFLVEKLREEAGADGMVTDALKACFQRERWERAFELILSFGRIDLADAALRTAYLPLLRSGQLATLSSFTRRVRELAQPSPIADLVEAEIALADGDFDLAARLAARVRAALERDHPLTSRAHLICAQHAYFSGDLKGVAETSRGAYETAQTDRDQADALRGWALVTLQSETPLPSWVRRELEARRHRSPLDVVRFASFEVIRLHFFEGYAAAPALLAQAERAVDEVADPHLRSAFFHVATFVTTLALNLEAAGRLRDLTHTEIETFDLDFARPHALWNRASLALAGRRFGEAERQLQKLEDLVARHPLGFHVVNGKLLRGRLALETGRPDQALSLLPVPLQEAAIPSVQGEYLAIRALALAAVGDMASALETAEQALGMTTVLEVRVMAAAVRAACAGPRDRVQAAETLWQSARDLAAWVPVITAVRGCPALATLLASAGNIRDELGALYQRSNDVSLARQAGLRVRATRPPSEVLSPRELEVLGLVARGFHNSDIAQALVVSQSTVKVHVRHILEKLGVRTRAEAATRLSQFD